MEILQARNSCDLVERVMDSLVLFSIPHFLVYTFFLNVRSLLTPVAMARSSATTIDEPFGISWIVNQSLDGSMTPLVMIIPNIRPVIRLFSLWAVLVMVSLAQ